MSEDEMENEEEGVIRCICGFDEDDGFTIQCEKCLVWQHAVCVQISKNSVPEKYYCDECMPRPLDAQWAKDLQKKRRNGKTSNKRKKKSAQAPKQDFYTDFDDFIQDYIPSSRLIITHGVSVLADLISTDSPVASSSISSPTSGPSLASASSAVSVRSAQDSKSVGIFSSRDLLENTQILKITGFLVPTTPEDSPFMFPINDTLTVDCRRFGNEFRFIRFSCQSNCHLLIHSTPSQDSNVEYAIDGKKCDFSISLIPDFFLPKDSELLLPWSGRGDFDRCCCGQGHNCSYRARQREPVKIVEQAPTPAEIMQQQDEPPSATDPPDSDDILSKPDRLLTREERKIRNELLQFAKLENSGAGGKRKFIGDSIVSSRSTSPITIQSPNLRAVDKVPSSNGSMSIGTSVTHNNTGGGPRNMKKAWIGLFMDPVDPEPVATSAASTTVEEPPVLANHGEESNHEIAPDHEEPEDGDVSMDDHQAKESDTDIQPILTKRKSGLDWSTETLDLVGAPPHVSTELLKNDELQPDSPEVSPVLETPPTTTTNNVLGKRPAPEESGTVEDSNVREATATTRISLKDYKKKRKLLDESVRKDSLTPVQTSEDNNNDAMSAAGSGAHLDSPVAALITPIEKMPQ